MSIRKLLVLLLFASLLLTACNAATAPTATPIPPTPTSEPSAFPLSLTDGLGREVVIEQAPERIVSLAPSNSEILFALGLDENVVGVTKYCNHPPQACEGKEVIGGFSAKSISVETILALEPDLVVAAGQIHQPIIEAMEQQDIPVIALTARTFDDVYANIQLLGRVTGRETEAVEVAAEMQAQVEAVTAKTGQISETERLTVFWEVWDEPLMTAGPGTFIGQMIELAGGVNIFGDVEEDYPKISAEEVIKRNPAVILGPDSHGEKLTPEQLAQRPGWEEIQAVQNGRVHLIDGDIVSRPGPRLAQGLAEVARALYPDLFD